VRFWKSEVSVASGGSDAKADLAQIQRQLGRSIKLLDVSFLGSPIVSSDLSEGGDLAR
jgi:hypothetical protein